MPRKNTEPSWYAVVSNYPPDRLIIILYIDIIIIIINQIWAHRNTTDFRRDPMHFLLLLTFIIFHAGVTTKLIVLILLAKMTAESYITKSSKQLLLSKGANSKKEVMGLLLYIYIYKIIITMSGIVWVLLELPLISIVQKKKKKIEIET